MKLDEIIVETEKLDEVPAGGIGQMAKKVGAKVLNKIPGGAAKSKAGNLAGQADLGDTANNLHKEFNKYLGTQGKNMKSATGEDLAAFLKTKSHKTSATIPSGILQKQQINDLLMTVSKEALAGKGGMGKSTSPVDANKDGKDDATGKPMPQDGDSKDEPSDQEVKKRVPAKLYAALLKLTSEEKKKLAELI